MAANNNFQKYHFVGHHAAAQLPQWRLMKDLEVNKPYKIFGILPTLHETFGPGYVFYMQKNAQSKVRVQMSPRWLQSLGQEGVNQISLQISQNRPPFLIYRGMKANGYLRADIVLASDPNIVQQHTQWQDVDEIDDYE